MEPATPTVLDYLRHGEPVGGSRFRGHGIDDPLSEHGWRQMRHTSAALSGWQRVISSPMRRCLEFAQWLAEDRELPLSVHQDLKEVGFGNWEGLDRAQLQALHPEEYAAFYRDPVHNRPQGAEPLQIFGSRVAKVFDSLVHEHAGEHLLVVGHAGVIRATLGYVINAPAVNWYRSDVANAALTRFASDRRGTRLVIHNWRPAL